MLIHEGAFFREGLLVLRATAVDGVLNVGHSLEHQEVGIHPGLEQFLVGADHIAQHKVARAGGQYGRRKVVEVAVERRQQWV
jgi:hypothetical protein